MSKNTDNLTDLLPHKNVNPSIDLPAHDVKELQKNNHFSGYKTNIDEADIKKLILELPKF